MTSQTPYPTLQRFVAAGGTIDVGRIENLERAAIASDSRALWVALDGRPGELLHELMLRLDASLAVCLANGTCVDEFAESKLAAGARATEEAPPRYAQAVCG